MGNNRLQRRDNNRKVESQQEGRWSTLKVTRERKSKHNQTTEERGGNMRSLTILALVAASLLVLASGCQKALDPVDNFDSIGIDDESPAYVVNDEYPAPALTVTATQGDQSLEFWPYTGTSFNGQPQDPINLIFIGKADPREIMHALLSLDGNRADFPPVPPFTSTWTDAIGDVQTAWGAPSGWTGGAVQLACGNYDQVRFHLRLFRMGEWTVGNAHFEVLIPGTADHQVLSWELAEQFVAYDLIRSGLLSETDGVTPTAQINDSPFRTIPAIIYNELPVELRQLIGGPLDDVTDDVPIATDGHAVILNLASAAQAITQVRVQDFVLDFDQVISKPFCSSGPEDYVYVSGPVRLYQRVAVLANGNYIMHFDAQAELSVTPVNPFTGEPVGNTLKAMVQEQHDGLITDQQAFAAGRLSQKLLPPSDPDAGRLSVFLKAGEGPGDLYRRTTQCPRAESATSQIDALVDGYLGKD
jgi:hypothetical protein